MSSTAAPRTRLATTFARLCMFAAACSGVVVLTPSAARASEPNACSMLSSADLHRYFGKSWIVVSHKTTPPEKSRCDWGPPRDYSRLTVQIVAADQYVTGDANLPGVGEKAALDNVSIFNGAGLWRGRAVKGKYAVNFFTSSKGVSRATALAVLKQLVSRM